MVDINSNPLYYAAIGGIIIGIATSLNYALRGSVTGMSGMVYGTVNLDKNEMPKNIAIIGGMLLAGGIFFDIFGYERYNNFQPFGPKDQIAAMTNYIGYGVAGFLVGFGTKLSNGCTSGHGLCGIARFSIRSIVAVCTFLLTGIIIATIGYHKGGLGGLTDQSLNPNLNYEHLASANICIIIGILLPLLGLYLRFQNKKEQQQKQVITIPQQELQQTDKRKQQYKFDTKEFIVRDQVIVFFVGLLFGFGLLVAGMVRRSNIIMFLSLGKDWNPSLMFVLGCGLIINLIVFNYFIRVKKSPIFGQKLFNPQINVIDWKLVLGAMCFGLGWGIGGLCPGPTIMQFPIFTVPIHCIWLPFMIIGQLIANQVSQIDFSQRLSPNETPTKVQTKNQIKPADKIINQIQLNINSSKVKDNNENMMSDTKIYQNNEQQINKILHQHGHGFEHAKKLNPIIKTNLQQNSNLNLLKSFKQIKKNQNQKDISTNKDVKQQIVKVSQQETNNFQKNGSIQILNKNDSIIENQKSKIQQIKQTVPLVIGSGKYHIDQNQEFEQIQMFQFDKKQQKNDK